jgi:hypothetical protein
MAGRVLASGCASHPARLGRARFAHLARAASSNTAGPAMRALFKSDAGIIIMAVVATHLIALLVACAIH